MRFLKSPWFKVLLIAVFIGAVLLILRKFNINFSGVTEEGFKEKVNSFGIWGPVLYVIVYLLRPLILFPAGVLSASAGLIWGPAKGFFILQIGANISAVAEFFLARYFGRELIKKYLKGKMTNLDEKIEK
ncbi:MAG: TVP38/TMEM64 family protein, partial [Candidatus Omnitrophica bacterium]|nr:TVP38/TMEM64 family protein [Candidatus Omnitrophota bacterium]